MTSECLCTNKAQAENLSECYHYALEKQRFSIHFVKDCNSKLLLNIIRQGLHATLFFFHIHPWNSSVKTVKHSTRP